MTTAYALGHEFIPQTRDGTLRPQGPAPHRPMRGPFTAPEGSSGGVHGPRHPPRFALSRSGPAHVWKDLYHSGPAPILEIRDSVGVGPRPLSPRTKPCDLIWYSINATLELDGPPSRRKFTFSRNLYYGPDCGEGTRRVKGPTRWISKGKCGMTSEILLVSSFTLG